MFLNVETDTDSQNVKERERVVYWKLWFFKIWSGNSHFWG